MIKFWISIVLLLTLGTYCLAEVKKVEAPADCKQCGMSRMAFDQSRMVVTYTDGNSSGTCSLNCVVVDLKESKDKEVKSFQVADFNTKTLIDAKTAAWVIGGKKKGVMTPVAKWAFAERKGAEEFINEYGGKLATFAEALKATEKELDEEGQSDKHQGHKCNCGHMM